MEGDCTCVGRTEAALSVSELAQEETRFVCTEEEEQDRQGSFFFDFLTQRGKFNSQNIKSLPSIVGCCLTSELRLAHMHMCVHVRVCVHVCVHVHVCVYMYVCMWRLASGPHFSGDI